MQELIEHLPAVIYEYAIHPDGNRKFNYLSHSSKNILGLAPEDVMNQPELMESIIHKDDLADLQESSRVSEDKKGEWSWQGRIRVSEKIKWIEIRSNHEMRKDGVIVRRGIIQDITERKVSTQESELRYQSLVERLPIGIAIHNHGKLVFANAQALQILGAKKPSDLVGTHVLNYVHPADRDRILERLKEAVADTTMVEQKFVRLDGKVIDVEAMAYPFTFKGTPSVQVIFRDITERKITEAQIKKNETLFTQLFQNVPIATVMLDESGKVQEINKGFKETFGYELHELKGRNLNDLIVPDELRNEGIDLNNLITSNQTISVETFRRHKQGKLVSVIIYGVPVMLDNQTIGIYGVYVDITERKRVEEELKIRNTELDNFVYKVSHDLRAPLSSILGLVNLSKLPGNSDDPMDYINIIGEKVEHLDHFIGDVLSHSKNLKLEVSTSKVDINQIIDRTFMDLNYLEEAKNMNKIVKVEGIDFYSDPWRISEIFRNLISNAIKYRQLENVGHEISIKIHIDNLRADISFADNGIGIDEVNLARIFEMFYRATEQSDGSGIGLYIVKNAVDKLGGQISVASRVGQGTRFNIILPNRINSVINKSPIHVVEPQ